MRLPHHKKYNRVVSFNWNFLDGHSPIGSVCHLFLRCLITQAELLALVWIHCILGLFLKKLLTKFLTKDFKGTLGE